MKAAAVETQVDWPSVAKELDTKSPLEIMDHVSALSALDNIDEMCHDSTYRPLYL